VISPRSIAEHFVVPSAAGVAGQRATDAAEAEAAVHRGSAEASAWAPSVAVLAPPSHGPPLGSALAFALACGRRAPVGLVSVWAPGDASLRGPWHGPGMPAATRLAVALGARGHEARTSGRVVGVRLAQAADEAAAEAGRVAAAAGSAPAVLVLAGPRSACFDDVLAAQDLVVVAVAPDGDPVLARLAAAGLERAVICFAPPADPARALAAAGIALLPAVRRALAGPLAALS
jgi:hypothetical protein